MVDATSSAAEPTAVRDRPGPLISICIPVHEPDVGFLHELLRSISQQDDVDLEVVLIDDASAVDVRPQLEAWGDRLAITFDRNEQNLGMVGNWNEVVRRSRGDLVMLVCQDDVLAPGMLARYRQEFTDDEGVVLCGGAEVFIDERGEDIDRQPAVTQRSRIYRRRERYDLDATDLARLCLRNGQAFGEPSAVMFRRRVFDEVGGYRDRYEHAPDIDYNLRAAARGFAVYVNHPYLRRRIHGGNLTLGHIASGATSRDRVQLHEEYAPAVADIDRRRARVTLVSFALRDTLRALRRQRWSVATSNLKVAWRYKRNRPRHYVEHLWEIGRGSNIDER